MKLKSQNSSLKLETPAKIMAKWQPLAKIEEADNTITILDVIDPDYGVSAQRIAAALRAIGDKPVTVLINSPGGDAFEGVAIYNLLKNHGQPITVKVLSLAASAASIVAMAGNTIEMMDGSMIMIHNSWGFAFGNKADMTEAAEMLEKFDQQMAEIYMAKTAIKSEQLFELMNAETWMNGIEALEMGFADVASPEKAQAELSPRIAALRTIESALRSCGLSRKERRELIKNFVDKPEAIVEPPKPVEPEADLSAVLEAANKVKKMLEENRK